jgi:hypothetical protein
MNHTTNTPQLEFQFDEPRKYCTSPNCQRGDEMLPLDQFYRDKYAPDGRTYRCKKCMNADKHIYMQNPEPKRRHDEYMKTEAGKACLDRYYRSDKGKETNRIRMARRRKTPEHKPKEMARTAVKHAVRSHAMPKAKDLPCHFCENQAKEYHHHLGYEPEHWLDVIPVCKACHTKAHINDNHWLK